MKKRYVYKQKIWLQIIAVITLLLVIAGLILNTLKLLSIGTLVSYNFPLDIASIVLLSIVGIIIVALFGFSGYTTKQDKVCFNLGFYFKSFDYSKICMIRQDSDKTMLFLYVLTDKKGMVYDKINNLNADILQIVVNEKYFEQIIDTIKEKNPKAIYELVRFNTKRGKNESNSGK